MVTPEQKLSLRIVLPKNVSGGRAKRFFPFHVPPFVWLVSETAMIGCYWE